jgi:D-alanyl-lipoteichoic acid acyltransferase DltB (MBOAT superfamily)
MGRKWRWQFLLALSCGLLLWWGGPQAFAIALAQTALAYLAALWLKPRAAPVRFWLSVLAQLAPLIVFKWQGMSDEDPATAARWAVPLGLSFYTFQILSYLIEVQWGRRSPERNLARLAGYILFFANKIAGPIERPALLDRMRDIPTPDSAGLVRSAAFIWLGLFQKFVLADHLAEYVVPVFKNPDGYSGAPASLVVLLSKYQIFCDFSGISLVAMGLGGLFGLELTRNFNRPFAAGSLREFWTRWHISLQTWIRDYVFYPLLSTPLARWGVGPALAVSFVVFGLWHDFRWTFVVYGLLQAVLIRIDPSHRLAFFRPLAVLFNFVVLVCLPSVLFRADSLTHARDVWLGMGVSMKNWEYFTVLGEMKLYLIGIFMLLNEAWQWAESRYDVYGKIAGLPWVTKMTLAVALMTVLVAFAKLNPESMFIYSRF